MSVVTVPVVITVPATSAPLVPAAVTGLEAAGITVLIKGLLVGALICIVVMAIVALVKKAVAIVSSITCSPAVPVPFPAPPSLITVIPAPVPFLLSPLFFLLSAAPMIPVLYKFLVASKTLEQATVTAVAVTASTAQQQHPTGALHKTLSRDANPEFGNSTQQDQQIRALRKTSLLRDADPEFESVLRETLKKNNDCQERGDSSHGLCCRCIRNKRIPIGTFTRMGFKRVCMICGHTRCEQCPGWLKSKL